MNSTTSPSAGFFTEALGQAAYAFAEVQPYLPMYLHLILSALFPIVTGAHASLVRPSTAAKPKKKAKKTIGDEEDVDDDEDEEESLQKMEGLSNSDALVFPLLAGSTLAGLYFLIKWAGADVINKILGWYFSSIAIFSVAKLVNDGLTVIESFCWPEYYVDQGVIWHVKSSERKAIEISERSNHQVCSRPSPLPGVLGRIHLAPKIQSVLWSVRDLPSTGFIVRAHISKVVTLKLPITLRTIFSTVLGLTAIFVSNFVSKAWWLTNLQGFAFSYNALQLMSPTTFGTGSLILGALFFYDIYFVFYTPMMVTVATKLDVPIKLLFPRPIEEGDKIRRMAMLGLGDIVLPGIMIGLALRFDLWMHYLGKQTKAPVFLEADKSDPTDNKQSQEEQVHKERYQSVTGHWGNSFWTSSWTGRSQLLAVKPLPTQQPSPATRRALIPTFRKPYFYAAIGGYIAGMCATLGIMQVFRHAQPALLYLVPGVLISLWGTGLVRGELKQMHEFTEAEEEDPETTEADGKKNKESEDKNAVISDDKSWTSWSSWSSWFEKSVFSSTSTERSAKRIEKSLTNRISTDKSESEDTIAGAARKETEKEEKAKEVEPSEKKKQSPVPSEFFLFSITLAPPRGSKAAKTKQSSSSAVGSEEAVVVGDAETSTERTPRWRGARVSEESKEERPEKRIRTS